MLKIEKNQLPNMRDSGGVKNTEHYTIAEYENRGFRLEELAQRISSQIDSYFILYDYKGNIYTDNEDVIQILKDQFPSGDYSAYSDVTDGFEHDNLNIEWDTILILDEHKEYQFENYYYIPKWHYLYKRLGKLLNGSFDFLSKQTEGQELYNKCYNSKEFREQNEWIEKFENEWNVKSLDPIHIFASLNNNKINYDKRIKRINILFRLLDTNFKEDLKEIDFQGCPAPNTTKIMSARDEKTQDEIWKLFKEVTNNSQEININFEQVRQWYGVDIGSFTIFLFWIDAYNFLPLDKHTERLLTSNEKIKKLPESYSEYKKLLEKKNTNLYLLLALVAVDTKNQEILNEHDKEKLFNYLKTKEQIATDSHGNEIAPPQVSAMVISPSEEFKLIAIKPLTGCNKKYLKTLKESEYYIFDKAYSIYEDTIEVNPQKNISLYDLENVKLNINAIVGKNGTGKSTVVELMFAMINNIAVIQKINKDIKKIEGIKVEFVFVNKYLYKIVLDDDSFKCYIYKADNGLGESTDGAVQVYEYSKDDKVYKNTGDYANSFTIDQLFYTIAVNYSQYALNSQTMDEWIDKLFHKNDAYQTPIVIEPYRRDGNIDVNNQEALVKQRLLANILLQEDESEAKSNSTRKLTEFYSVEKLKFSFDKEKFTNKHKDIREKYLNQIKEEDKILFFDIFEIDKTIEHPLAQYAKEYIFIKLISISLTYSHYQNRFDEENKTFNNPREYFENLKSDNSHITNKLKQAVNFLKYSELQYAHGQIVDIEKCSNQIEKIKQKNSDEIINRYLPPSFLDVEIILENNISFDTLSSGEKQKIYSVNSVLYHLNNINSVDEKLKKYREVSIILDEVELYFHPELQRNYVSYLRNVISKANTNSIVGINILFVTHSPFILSDIPDSKILFLDKDTKNSNSKTTSVDKNIKTFGANVHELLIDGFFMKNSIGEFALQKIKKIIDFHYIVLHEQKELLKLKEEYQSLKEEFHFILEHIGEEYIKGIIQNHILDIEKKLEDDTFKAKRIEALKKELQQLEGNK